MKHNLLKQRLAVLQRLSFVITFCFFILFLMSLSILAGCASSKETRLKQPNANVHEISDEKNEIFQTMQAAETVLGKMHFEIEKTDFHNGYIRTRKDTDGK